MFKSDVIFSSFAVRDIDEARHFYSDILGVDVEQTDMGLQLKIEGGSKVFVYSKPDHQPANYTILNFQVRDIEETIEYLVENGVIMENYKLPNGAQTDELGILRGKKENMGPNIAWFKDPSGNVLSIIEE